MPISLVAAELDTACTLEWTEWLAGNLSTLQNYYLVNGVGHGWPIYNSSAQYLELLMNEVDQGSSMLASPNR